MNILLYLALIPVVGALIGWSTNWLAVRLLFRPYQPIGIRGTPFVIQGLIPKRRRDLARTIGRVVQDELLSVDDLLAQLNIQDVAAQLAESVGVAVYEAVIARLPGIVPRSVKTYIAEKLADLVAERMPGLVDLLVDEVAAVARRELKIAAIIEDRMNNFPLETLERVIYQVASRELRAITALGGVIGFMIGLVQVAIYYFLLPVGGLPLPL